MDPPQAASKTSKRKRFEEMKNNVVDEIYSLVISSDAFETEVLRTNEEFSLIFDSMKKRQMDLTSQAVIISEKYGHIADIVEEKKKPKIGEMSASFESLPLSYAKSIDRFLEDSESLDDLGKKFNGSVETWSNNYEKLKDQANYLAHCGTRHRIEVDKFRSVLHSFIPVEDISESDISD